MQENKVVHEIAPVYDKNSTILILGSFPSVKSRESRFFYGHPQNRFWKTIAAVYGVDVPITVDEKKKMLIDQQIALWDVIESCTITGSSDSSIKNVIPNDLTKLLEETNISKIFVNGGTAYKLYEKYTRKHTGIPAIKLPSTSPANAAFRLEKLIEHWKIIKE